MEALSQKFLDRFHLFEVRSSPNPGSRLCAQKRNQLCRLCLSSFPESGEEP